ncbi:MAG: universal stress protein [Cytophagales bacterium]|nr:universal stress protein [Cytophagales bacterium]
MKTIFVPMDFSKEATHALDVAVALARPAKATVVLLHVIQSVYEEQYASGAELPADARQRLDQKVDKAQQQLRQLVEGAQAGDVTIHCQVKVGSIFITLPENISAAGTDLIVMGTKGDSGFHEVVEGSNAEKVVRSANCPIITVGKPVKGFTLRNVVLATDFDHRVGPLLDLLHGWQSVFGFKLHLVYVNTPLNYSTTFKMQERLEKFLKKHPLENYTTALIDEYSEKDGILRYADLVQADLVALLTHGRQGLAYLLDGSIASQVVNHAQVPVLTYNMHADK